MVKKFLWGIGGIRLKKRTIRCPECGKWYSYEDEVIQDFARTNYHKDCYQSLTRRVPYEESGTFLDLCTRKDYLSEMLPVRGSNALHTNS